MRAHDIVVVGASAGGVEPLIHLVGSLPWDLAAAVFVVLHMRPDAPSLLPDILSRSGPLPAGFAVDGETVRHGQIYVAPPNHHLYVRGRHVHVAVGPRENGARPSVDVLFRSAARSYGPRVVGVVLSGALSDGALGLESIKARGGLAMVQDPEEALFVGMPHNALVAVDVDYCAPVDQIAGQIVNLVSNTLEQQPMDDELRTGDERDPIDHDPVVDTDREADAKRPGTASGLSCPDCDGSIWELREGDMVRFECRIGHSYSPDAFVAQQGERVEAALWTAINLLRERSETFSRLAGSVGASTPSARRFRERADETDRHAQVLRGLVDRLLQSGDVG